jgi:methyl-accepting chemotaxis protein
MGSINESSKKIVDIITVIDGIAFQTNILALNAAVEAARAGEQGRGFAVVAGEVRTLAQRSAAAAKEIKALIGDSVDKVGAGTKLVDQAGNTMSDVVASIQRVTDIMAEISAASQEQTSGIEQINQAVSQMDNVTQQNASLVEEAAAASEALQSQAAKLAELVSVFRIDDRAPATASRVPVRAEPVMTALAAPAVKPTIKPAVINPNTAARPIPAAKAAPARASAKASAATAADDWEEF